MTLWRYKAVGMGSVNASSATARTGELSAASAAEVRASLRRIGLQVIEVRPARRTATSQRLPALRSLQDPLRSAWHRHQRSRRTMQRAELYDGLSTMLDSGLPLLEAVETLIGEPEKEKLRWFGRGSAYGFGLTIEPRRAMLTEVREALRGGSALDEACRAHAGWFEPSELAMIHAGQLNGDLAGVLRQLAERQQRSGELAQKISGALAYPAVIAAVGLGVVLFLSVKTLPDLVAILEQSDVAVPALTECVMAAGQFLFHGWWMIICLLVAIFAALVLSPALIDRLASRSGSTRTRGANDQQRRWSAAPKLIRRIAVANMSLHLSELIRTGVPMVEALRVLAPTAQLRGLTRLLRGAADDLERGEDLVSAFNDARWFDHEYRQLLAIGQTTGELDELLERIGRRYRRQAERLIDRLAALLEPVVLLSLAVLIGFVVMAAILPLIRLQEVLG